MTPKVALITGSAQRIGATIAQVLHEAGFNLVVHYRHSQEAAQTLTAGFNKQRPHSALALQADLKETSGLKSLISATVAEWGRLDVLINNASCFIKTSLEEEPQEQVWDELFSTNLKAPFFLSQAAYPHLQLTSGCIVNLTDIHVNHPMRDYAVYCASKGGLVTLTKALAKEFGPVVRVNAISPGMVAWPEGENMLPETLKQKIIAEAALKRIGKPQDVAKAVLFLIRDADYITGQVLAVDGGRLL